MRLRRRDKTRAVEVRQVGFWTYVLLAAGVLVLLNVLFVILLALANRSGHESDLPNGQKA